MEDTLDLTRRHVVTGRQIITHQLQQIEFLKLRQLDTREAERTLELFEQSQRIFEEHLRALETAARLLGSHSLEKAVRTEPLPKREAGRATLSTHTAALVRRQPRP